MTVVRELSREIKQYSGLIAYSENVARGLVHFANCLEDGDLTDAIMSAVALLVSQLKALRETMHELWIRAEQSMHANQVEIPA